MKTLINEEWNEKRVDLSYDTISEEMTNSSIQWKELISFTNGFSLFIFKLLFVVLRKFGFRSKREDGANEERSGDGHNNSRTPRDPQRRKINEWTRHIQQKTRT